MSNQRFAILSGLGAFAFAALFIWVLLVPIGGRHRAVVQEHRESACHSLGRSYHYWQDRDQCVRYVPLGVAASLTTEDGKQ